jgi:spore coat polysaccharide biosynthesis protein SpsF (cytidylyltransferase family)
MSYCSRDGRPAILSPVGVYAEWFRSAALRRVARAARSRVDREQVTRYIYSHPEEFNLRLIPAPAEIDRDDVRLTVDIEEDWDHALAIFEALGPEALDWQRIADLLDHQPAMRRRMAVLNRACSKG